MLDGPRLERAGVVRVTDYSNFFAVAAMAMRQVLANHAESKRALKRGALADGQTGAVPNPSWGFGKLDAAAALDALRVIVEEGLVRRVQRSGTYVQKLTGTASSFDLGAI